MNSLTVLAMVVSLLTYSVYIYLLLCFPNYLLENLRKHLLALPDRTKNHDALEVLLWNEIQSKVSRIIARKNAYIAKEMFLKGGIFLILWAISLLLFFSPEKTSGIQIRANIWTFFYIFLVQLVTALMIFFFHKKVFKLYVTESIQEQLVKEVQKQIEDKK